MLGCRNAGGQGIGRGNLLTIFGSPKLVPMTAEQVRKRDDYNVRLGLLLQSVRCLCGTAAWSAMFQHAKLRALLKPCRLSRR